DTNTYSDRTCSQGASSNPGQGFLERRPDGCDVRKLHPRDEQEAARIRLDPGNLCGFSTGQFATLSCDKSPAQATSRRRLTRLGIEGEALLAPPQRVSLAFVGQAVTNRIANAPYVLDLGLERPAALAYSNFIL